MEYDKKEIDELLKKEEEFCEWEREMIGKNLDYFKLTNESENVDEMIASLDKSDFEAARRNVPVLGAF